MASLISGIQPVKNGVDQVLAGVQAIAQSGAIPGVEQILAPVIALMNQILVMTAQQVMGPGGQGPQATPPPGPFSLGAGQPGQPGQ